MTSLVTSGRLVEALPLAALLVAGVALRIVLLGQQQLFRDEATSWYLASHSLGDMLGLAANETAPPLYLLLLKSWMAAFGDSEAALRSLSVVAGIGTIGITWRWAGDALGRTGALVAAALVALSPAMVAADREARMYSLETFLATLAWWLAWLMVAEGVSGPGGVERRRPSASSWAWRARSGPCRSAYRWQGCSWPSPFSGSSGSEPVSPLLGPAAFCLAS
jgi:uncharacterized membrane protein